ncbi:MAG: 50S ribosomal protein L13, large subunit ribosomal protein L13 [archaeon GW2011_AR9]|nr:MAG: 50S ribosomal protein L13, large subunit ribosomal protein L13 [archaeon GW2011_AR9]MBS3120950.1 50S ribosomal protein L13 [Candidatus Woesearchaeota archaeon]HIG92716.1 50S ribosomal protein L13 [Candidatus Woesearchaeota archaeon]HIH13593.1 50S ribosomal protein L13 [Candidatus Woesearchaeota archaeon]
MKVYNGDGIILGRLATRVAKDVLLGEEVKVVNCEKIIVSGNKTAVLAHEVRRWTRGGYPPKKTNHSRSPDRYVRKVIRGMLPWKFPRGKEAFRRILCYKGIPAELANSALITLADASAQKLPSIKYLTVQELCKSLGGK